MEFYLSFIYSLDVVLLLLHGNSKKLVKITQQDFILPEF
jgi:hypothetical protein